MQTTVQGVREVIYVSFLGLCWGVSEEKTTLLGNVYRNTKQQSSSGAVEMDVRPIKQV